MCGSPLPTASCATPRVGRAVHMPWVEENPAQQAQKGTAANHMYSAAQRDTRQPRSNCPCIPLFPAPGSLFYTIRDAASARFEEEWAAAFIEARWDAHLQLCEQPQQQAQQAPPRQPPRWQRQQATEAEWQQQALEEERRVQATDETRKQRAAQSVLRQQQAQQAEQQARQAAEETTQQQAQHGQKREREEDATEEGSETLLGAKRLATAGHPPAAESQARQQVQQQQQALKEEQSAMQQEQPTVKLEPGAGFAGVGRLAARRVAQPILKRAGIARTTQLVRGAASCHAGSAQTSGCLARRLL